MKALKLEAIIKIDYDTAFHFTPVSEKMNLTQ